MENPQSRIETWAIIELFGHQQEFGYVTTMYFGSSCFLRVEVPELPEREWVLERPEVCNLSPESWDRDDRPNVLPIGAKVKRAAVPARSPLLNPSAIYRLNPCTQEVVMAAMERSIHRPLIVTEMPKARQIPASVIELKREECQLCMAGSVPVARDGVLFHDDPPGVIGSFPCDGQICPQCKELLKDCPHGATDEEPIELEADVCPVCGARPGLACLPTCPGADYGAVSQPDGHAEKVDPFDTASFNQPGPSQGPA